MIFTTEAYDIMRDLTAKDPTNARWQNILVNICDRMATNVRIAGGTWEQRRTYRLTAEEHARSLVELEPTNPKWRMIHAYTLVRLGDTYVVDDQARARQALNKGIEIAQELFDQSPASDELAILLWDARNNLSALQKKAGRRDDGIRHLRKALENLQTLWAVRPEHPAGTVQMTNGYGNLAKALYETDEAGKEEALALLEEGIDFVERRVYEEGKWSKADAEAHGIPARADYLRKLRDELRAADEEEPPK
jgi:tetratricopeptide (TPR) repeat protein